MIPYNCVWVICIRNSHLNNNCLLRIIINFTLRKFFYISVGWWFFTGVWDSKVPRVSRTFLSILADLNNAIVWTVSTGPIVSKSSSPCTNPLVTVPRAPITHFTNPSARAGYDTRSIFKRSLKGLNSEFSFS